MKFWQQFFYSRFYKILIQLRGASRDKIDEIGAEKQIKTTDLNQIWKHELGLWNFSTSRSKTRKKVKKDEKCEKIIVVTNKCGNLTKNLYWFSR